MQVPSHTIELIQVLKDKYPDKLETDPNKVGTPEYWKTVGIVALIQELEYFIKNRK